MSDTRQWPPSGSTVHDEWEWHHLIGQVVDLKLRTGWGCALVWQHINRGDLVAARARMDELLADMQWYGGSPGAQHVSRTSYHSGGHGPCTCGKLALYFRSTGLYVHADGSNSSETCLHPAAFGPDGVRHRHAEDNWQARFPTTDAIGQEQLEEAPMKEIVLQAGDSASIVILHRDASMSRVEIEVDDLGTWGLVIDPNPAIPYSVVEPAGEEP